MGIGERFGQFDDENSIRADDPEQREPWSRAAWVSSAVVPIVAAVLLAGLVALLGLAAAFLTSFALVLVFLISYVVWRRRRNFRLTGSPTKWPARNAD